MGQQQLLFTDPAETPPPAVPRQAPAPDVPARAAAPDDRAGRRRPAARHRDALLAFLDEVTGRVREAEARVGTAADAQARSRLLHTVRNAQMIAGRARRAVEALPGTDLELLRAHGRLLAATREAQRTRTAAEFADRSRIPFAMPADQPSPQLTQAEGQPRAPR